jgi:competence protein ComEC
VDLLVISHGHNDHVGGVEALLDAVPAVTILSNVVTDWHQKRPCLAGERWHWDGVDFSVLHPSSADAGDGNDGSCVLKITAPGGRLLLPGDIEANAEAALLARAGQGLRAEVLVVPHHGGRSSSSSLFLDAVRPRLALFPLGYRNRHRFPHRDVIRRLTGRDVQMFDTARHGAISVKIDGQYGVQTPRLERMVNDRIWRARE